MKEKAPDQFALWTVGAGLTGLLVAILVIGLWVAWSHFGPDVLRQNSQSKPDASVGAPRISSPDRALLAMQPGNSALQAEQRFSRFDLNAPQSICRSFAPADQPDALWHRSLWNKSQWECFASFGPQQETGEEQIQTPSGDTYQVFIILRGTETALQSLRIKLSLDGDVSRSAGFAHFHALYGSMAAHLGVFLPPIFQESIDTKDWSQFVGGDYVATWSREYGEPPRYDLTIDFVAQGGKYFSFVEEPSPSLQGPNPAE